MNKWKSYTVFFVVLTIISIAVWDCVAIFFGGKEASISATFIVWSYKYPSFVFLMGFVMGHLFWRMGDNKRFKEELPKND